MGKLEEYLERAKDIAEEAGDVAKNFAGEAMSKAKELTEENARVRELTQSAKEHASTISLGAREKVQGIVSDAKAVKELSIGLSELEAMPELEGSILYTMEHESMVNSLKSLILFINDRRLDDASVAEEIKEVMAKMQPANMPVEAESAEGAEQTPAPEMSEEDKAIEQGKTIAYSACVRAIEALTVQGA